MATPRVADLPPEDLNRMVQIAARIYPNAAGQREAIVRAIDQNPIMAQALMERAGIAPMRDGAEGDYSFRPGAMDAFLDETLTSSDGQTASSAANAEAASTGTPTPRQNPMRTPDANGSGTMREDTAANISGTPDPLNPGGTNEAGIGGPALVAGALGTAAAAALAARAVRAWRARGGRPGETAAAEASLAAGLASGDISEAEVNALMEMPAGAEQQRIFGLIADMNGPIDAEFTEVGPRIAGGAAPQLSGPEAYMDELMADSEGDPRPSGPNGAAALPPPAPDDTVYHMPNETSEGRQSFEVPPHPSTASGWQVLRSELQRQSEAAGVRSGMRTGRRAIR